MYKRLTCLILLLLLLSVLFAPSGQAAAWTVRLERSSLTGLAIGFREPPLAGKDGGDWVWRLDAGGHNFVFKAPVSDPVLLLPMTIALDNGEPMWVQGTVSFGQIRMIVTFPPFTVVTGTGKIKMDARLDQYQAVILEPAQDVTKPPLNSDSSSLLNTPTTTTATKMDHPNWTLLVRNVEAYHGALQFSGKRGMDLWLVDADLDGEFGESTQGEHGDALAWGAEPREQAPLAPEVRLKSKRYHVSVTPDDAGAFNLTLTEI